MQSRDGGNTWNYAHTHRAAFRIKRTIWGAMRSAEDKCKLLWLCLVVVSVFIYSGLPDASIMQSGRQ